MATSVMPVKVDVETDKLISHAAHFLGLSKKGVVDDAVREYVENHREDIQAGVAQALKQLDGTVASSVELLTGFSREKLDQLGGVPEES